MDLDVATGFSSMRVSSPFPPAVGIEKDTRLSVPSVLYELVLNPEQHESLFDTAHNTLNSFGVLTVVSSAHAISSEVEFCNVLRLCNQPDLALDCVRSLPRCASVVYLEAVVLLQQTRLDESSKLFNTVGSQLGIFSRSLFLENHKT